MGKIGKQKRRTRKKNQPKNVRYNTEKRWVSNKIKKLEKHIEKYGDKDKQINKKLKELKERPVKEKEEG